LNPIFISHLLKKAQYHRRSKDRVKLPYRKAMSEYLLVAFLLKIQVGATSCRFFIQGEPLNKNAAS
jgi:hypothetical protein